MLLTAAIPLRRIARLAAIGLTAASLGQACRVEPPPIPSTTAETADTGPTCQGRPLPDGPHHWVPGNITGLGNDNYPDYCEMEDLYPGCLLQVPGAPTDGSCPTLPELVELTDWFADHAVGDDLVRCPPYGHTVATAELPHGGFIERTFYTNESFAGFEVQHPEDVWCCEGRRVSRLRGGHHPRCNPASYSAVPLTPEDF